VEVGREGVHHHDFLRQGAHYGGRLFLQKFVVAHPGHIAPEVAFDGIFPPVFQLFFQSLPHAFGLQAEGVATEVEDVFALVFWKIKPAAVRAERVVAVELAGKGEGGLVVHSNSSINFCGSCRVSKIPAIMTSSAPTA